MPNSYHPHTPFTVAQIARLSNDALDARLKVLTAQDISDEDPELVAIEDEMERREYDESDPSSYQNGHDA